MSQKTKHYDVAIVGGGMVGLCLALALKDFCKVAIIEARTPSFENQDIRALALSYSSQQILSALNVWAGIENKATPLQTIHISERGQFGVTRLNAAECGYQQFGAIVPAYLLAQHLYTAVKQYTQIDFIAPATIETLTCDASRASLIGKSDEHDFQMTCELVVIANGAHSELAQKMGISYQAQDITQHALVSTVEVSQPVPFTAYERFVNHDILALLPLAGNHYGAVWTARSAQIDHLKSLPENEFLSLFQEAFGHRVGRFKKIISARQAYPLRTVIAQKETAQRAVLLGNAAHTLHPAAGQGLNLALRRTAVLAEEIVKARRNAEDIASPEVLGRYLERTQRDVQAVTQFTHSLVDLFSHDENLLSRLRGMGLFLFDRVIPVKKWFAAQAIGVTHSNSLLSNGIALTTQNGDLITAEK